MFVCVRVRVYVCDCLCVRMSVSGKPPRGVSIIDVIYSLKVLLEEEQPDEDDATIYTI